MATVSETIPDLTRERALALYRDMVVIRRTEEALARAHAAGLVQGACHTYVGEEAVATGVSAHLRPDDTVLSTHRGHGHALAKGVPPRELMAELFGRATGLLARAATRPVTSVTTRPVTIAQARSCVPHSTPRATAKMEPTVATRSWPPPPPASSVRPISPRAPGTSSQNPGRNEAWAGMAAGSRDTSTETTVITVAPTNALDVAAEEPVGEELAGPRRVEHDEQRREATAAGPSGRR